MTVTHNLEVVASDEEQDGLVHFGVVYQGGFVPLGAVKAGAVAQHATSPTGLALADEEKSKQSASEQPPEPPASS